MSRNKIKVNPFERLSIAVSKATGSTTAFIIAASVILIWIIAFT